MLRVLREFLAPLIALLGASVVLGWAATRPGYATASSTWSAYTAVFLADSLLDRSSRSVWIPNAPTGYVDIRLAGRRQLRAVHITNGDNPPHHDRHTLRFRLALFEGSREVFGTNAAFARADEVIHVEVGGVWSDRIRVTILTHRGATGCLSDVSWDER